jgi:hypothetical protein
MPHMYNPYEAEPTEQDIETATANVIGLRKQMGQTRELGTHLDAESQPTKSFIYIAQREKHGDGYRYVRTAAYAVDIAPAYMEQWINVDDYKEGTVPEDYETYSFDGKQKFLYLTNDEQNFGLRTEWVEYQLCKKLPSHDSLVARANDTKEKFLSLGLSATPTLEEQIAVAESAETTPETLALLARSAYWQVADAAITNPNTSLETLVTLADNKDRHGLPYWGGSDTVSQDAMSMVDDRFPGFDWDEEDELKRRDVISLWIQNNHGQFYSGETLAFALTTILTSQHFNEETEDIVVTVSKLARIMNVPEAQLLHELQVIGSVTDEAGDKLWKVQVGKKDWEGPTFALLTPLFLDSVEWVPAYTLNELQAQEEWKQQL